MTRTYYSRYIQIYDRPLTSARYGFTPSYAEKDGKNVLKGEAHWTKINGFCLNTPWWNVWVLFRRVQLR